MQYHTTTDVMLTAGDWSFWNTPTADVRAHRRNAGGNGRNRCVQVGNERLEITDASKELGVLCCQVIGCRGSGRGLLIGWRR